MKKLAAVAAALLLSGCVTAETMMLDDRTAIISGSGDEYSSAARVQRRVFVEAATAAQVRGYRYFVIQNSRDTTTTGTRALPTQTYANAQANTNCGYVACNTSAYGQSQTFGGGFQQVIQPGMDVLVRFYREGEVDPRQDGVWDATAILAAQPKK